MRHATCEAKGVDISEAVLKPRKSSKAARKRDGPGAPIKAVIESDAPARPITPTPFFQPTLAPTLVPVPTLAPMPTLQPAATKPMARFTIAKALMPKGKNANKKGLKQATLGCGKAPAAEKDDDDMIP